MVDIGRCAMRPEFFPYAMSDLSARVRYAHGRVYVQNVSAKHGRCQLGLKEATIVLKQPGGFQAWFKDIHGTELVPDEEFLRALHPAMRKALEPLQIRNPIQVKLPLLVFDAPTVPGQPMKIWWDGGAYLRKQAFHAGLDIADVDGEIWCHGHHDGHQFEYITGYALLERADILGQPFRNLQGRIEIHPDSPDVLRLYDLKADLFGGFVGGEAHFKFGPSLLYEVKLDALRIQLEQFGRHNKLGPDAQMQGPARASIHLMGEGTDLSGLKGNGQVQVANGKLYRLPLLLDLLKAFGLRVPDRTAFEQALHDFLHRRSENGRSRPGSVRQRHQLARAGHAEPGRQQQQSQPRLQRGLGPDAANAAAGHQRSFAEAQRSALQDQAARQDQLAALREGIYPRRGRSTETGVRGGA